jgi:hypothetical protein
VGVHVRGFLLSVMGMLTAGALAQAPNRAYMGEDIFVAAGQQIHNATCVFCSVQVEGDVTGRVLVLFGSVNVSGRVERSTTVIGGNAVVDSAARIGGDTVVLAGNAVYETDESISGSAYVLGGHMSRMGKVHDGRGHRMSVGPVFFWLLAAVLILILLSALIAPRVRRRVGVASSAEFR